MIPTRSTCAQLSHRTVLTLLTALMFAAAAAANAQQAEPAPVQGVPGTAAPQPGQYPISIPVRTVNRAGITPGTGYVLLRDVKTLVDVSGNGRAYTLKTPRSTVRFTAGSRAATLNGHPAMLNATPVQLNETLLFPLASLSLLGCSGQPLEAMRDVRSFLLSCDDQDLNVTLSVLTFSNGNRPAGTLQPSAAVISRLRR